VVNLNPPQSGCNLGKQPAVHISGLSTGPHSHPPEQDGTTCLDSSPGSTSPPATVPESASAASPNVRSKEPRSSPIDPSSVHGDLTRRISKLERERYGYWQRILRAINKESF
jgi:hypothetical protein